ncbi:ATP-binding protein [Vogesella indigofera]|uniref:histidine kinase n=1 Tax=Vogesella indigofera TaxID=45465 RepID=A0ABT5I5E7_VOGIN|nr:ATP-binding protein [Vogesella indigofera]MDC7691417.1 ATP-binding protein [Vogesella indigofera]
MSKQGQLQQQTAGIGQAVILIVVILGSLQLVASGLLIRSGVYNYRQASQHATLNAANLDIFLLASAINRENQLQLGLLALTRPASRRESAELQLARTATDQRLQIALRRLARPLADDSNAALLQLQERQPHLRQRRQEVDKVLARRPVLFDENAIFGWKLSVGTWQDAIDKVLRLDAFLLSDGADDRLNRLAETKYQLWQLSRSLEQEGNALIIRAQLARKLNSTDEYELLRSRERALLLLESLRYNTGYLGDATLRQQLAALATQTWLLHQSADRQLLALEQGRVAPATAHEYKTAAQQVNRNLGVFFAELTRAAANRVDEQQQRYAQSLALNISFAVLALLLYAYLLLRMRYRILRPLQRMQRVLDAAADAILTVNANHRIEVANYGAEKMFGLPLAALQGLSLDDILCVDGADADWLDDEGRFDVSRAGSGRRHDGSRFFAAITVSPLVDGRDGRHSRRLLIIRDEHQRTIAEQSLARSMQLLSAIQRVESLLFARSPRQTVFREVLRILLDYFGVAEGLVLSLEASRDKSASFRIQARLGNSKEPPWVERFRQLPLAVALQQGQLQQTISEDGWTFLPIQIDSRTVMVAGIAIDSIAEAHYQALQPLLGACGSIVSFYAEEDRRRASERNLREVLQLEEAIYSASPVGLMRLDNNYHIVRANRAGEALFGTREDGLQGVPLRELLGSDEAWQQLQGRLEEVRHHDRHLNIEIECVQVSGKPIWVLFAGQLLFPGMAEDGVILACFDITGRREAEEGVLRARDAAAESRQQLELAIDSLDDAFALFDAGDRLVRCNSHFARLAGAGSTPETLKGQSFASVLRASLIAGEQPEPGYEEHSWFVERLARYGREASSFELRWNERWLQQASRRVPDGGAVCVLTDISALKQQQADLLLARDAANAASRAKSAFLAAMSHEIRTPMNGVLGMLELLSLTTLDEAQRDAVDTVQESAHTLLRLIDDILDFSKIEAGKLEIIPEPASVRALMQRVHHLYTELAQRKQLWFLLDIDEQVAPALRFDPLRLRQILQNFCSNALKFTQQGQVTLRVRCLESSASEQWLRFEVADTGIGIDRQQLARLFEPFTQAESSTARRFGGTGLGLTICRRLSELMGGVVAMDSEPGSGTVASLEIRFPLCDAAELPLASELDHAAIVAATAGLMRDMAPVLFVEDNSINRKLTVKQFELLGYPVVTAVDGLMALSLWQQQTFSLVLTDCHMPQMDGYALAQAIRSQEAAQGRAPVPIIACTANVAKEELDKTRAAGMDDFLSKPLGLAALKDMLHKWLGDVALTPAPLATAVVAATPAAAVDRQALAMYSAGDWSVEQAILDEFMQGNDEDVAALARAVAAGDAVQIAWSAHRIKGASRMVGAMALGDAAEALEKAGRAAELAAIPALWQQFNAAQAAVAAWLEEQASCQASA